MWFPKFERAKQHNPALAGHLDRLMEYMRHQVENGETFFIPKLAAAALSLNDGEAYVLLELLAREGTLQRAFNVYCKQNGALVATVHDEAELAHVPHCNECDMDHEPYELRLEIAYEPADDKGPSRKAA